MFHCATHTQSTSWLKVLVMVFFLITFVNIILLQCQFADRYFRTCGLFYTQFLTFHGLLMVDIIGFS